MPIVVVLFEHGMNPNGVVAKLQHTAVVEHLDIGDAEALLAAGVVAGERFAEDREEAVERTVVPAVERLHAQRKARLPAAVLGTTSTPPVWSTTLP